MSVFVLLENKNFWKKHQISPPCSSIDNLMKNIKISVIFKQINATVSRPGNTVPFLQLACCKYLTHTRSIRVLSGSLGSKKIHIISDPVQIIATALAWCISAVDKIWTESEIIQKFFYPGVSDRKKIHIISDPV